MHSSQYESSSGAFRSVETCPWKQRWDPGSFSFPSPLPPSHEVTCFLFHVFHHDVPTKTRCLAIGQPDWDLQNVTLDTPFLFMCLLVQAFVIGPESRLIHGLGENAGTIWILGTSELPSPDLLIPKGLCLFQSRLVLGCQRRAEVQVSFPSLLHTGDSPLKSFTLQPLVGPYLRNRPGMDLAVC